MDKVFELYDEFESSKFMDLLDVSDLWEFISPHVRCKGCGVEMKFYDLNFRMVYAFLNIGLCATSAKLFCGLMNLPFPSDFKPYEKIIGFELEKACKKE
ncbi:hypothetical protein HHI36_007834 [Cryptolaemus montrouzieri]|uniref:Uncharacterized protein n=1 Tax=Cryptolaemus montrouzieri TaxID=559131 RepID=A0ABD2MRA6_9CUCU